MVRRFEVEGFGDEVERPAENLGVDSRDIRAGDAEGKDHHAGEEEVGDLEVVAAGDEIRPEDGGGGAGETEEGEEEAGDGPAEEDGERDSERRPPRDPQGVGFDQRVAKKPLEDDPGDGEGSADRESEEKAGEADLEHDGGGGLVRRRAAGEGRPEAPERHRHRSDLQGEGGDGDKSRDEDREYQAFFHRDSWLIGPRPPRGENRSGRSVETDRSVGG